MHRVRRLDSVDWIELDVALREMIEETCAAAEQDRHQVDPDLVGEAGCEYLLDEVGATHDRDVAATGGGLGLLQGAFRCLR